jgi:hypothetical protein
MYSNYTRITVLSIYVMVGSLREIDLGPLLLYHTPSMRENSSTTGLLCCPTQLHPLFSQKGSLTKLTITHPMVPFQVL